MIKAKINLTNSKKLFLSEFKRDHPHSHNPMNSSPQSDELFTTVLGLFNKGTIKVHIISKIENVFSLKASMIALGEDNMLNSFDHTVRSTPAH